MPRPAAVAMPRRPRHILVPRLLALIAVLAATLAAGSAPAAADIFPGDPVIGPSPALVSLGGIDLAPDGSGALVATMQDGGVDHVFVSRLVNGAWSGPERVDGGLPGPSSQPVVAAGNGGRVLVAFVNAGNVYVVTRADARSAPTTQRLWSGAGASDPSLDLSVNGKGYLAFTAPGAGGHDVRVACSRDAGPWTLIGAPLDANAAADAGVGSGRPRVGAAADGVAVVVWGEGGHVIARRVWGLQPSVVSVDANAGLVVEGVQAASADEPVVGVEDDDSFTGVALRATFVVGGVPRTRAIYRRLRGSRFEGPVTVGATPFSGGEDATDPSIAMVHGGDGLVVASGTPAFLSYGMVLTSDGGPSAPAQLDTIAQSTALPHAVAAAATHYKMLAAWQFAPAGSGPAIHARYWDGTTFGLETLFSKPALGPTDAAAGIDAAGDDSGDIALAYVQDVPGQGPAIAVATVDQPPGPFAIKRLKGFLRSTRPVLSWTPSKEAWGGYFRVTIDGVQVGLTGRRSFRPPALAQGLHTWQVTALDHRGQQYAASPSTLRIDTVPPVVRTRVRGARRPKSALRLAVRASDAPPPVVPPAAPIPTAGVASVFVDWGDGTRQRIVHGARHAYARAGRYRLRIVVTDRAGNRTTIRQTLRIAAPRRKHGHAARKTSAHRSRAAGPAR
jgi:PKD domain-containing protein